MNSSAARKGMPLFSGCMMYFPDALLAVAEHSRKANDKHNPGEPLHWSKDKSKDHADCIARHLIDIGPNWDAVDPEFASLHATALAWRALALLQTVIERKRGADSTKDEGRQQRLPVLAEPRGA
jgi:acyl dehydratase